MEGRVRFKIVYDLRYPGAWKRACFERALWCKLCTDHHALDSNHIIVTFRSKGPKWEQWEDAREELLLSGRAARWLGSGLREPVA